MDVCGYDAVQESHPLECDVGAIEARQQPFILGRVEVEIFFESGNPRVSDVWIL